MAKVPEPQQVIDEWLERDLTAAAQAGQLAPAFEVADLLQQITELINSGRYPILAGPSGVGKTAVIHELIRRVHAGQGPDALKDKRFLQFSILHRAAGLSTPRQVASAMQHLVGALLKMDADILPFFRDLHLAQQFGLGPLLQSLAMRYRQPILGEGTVVDALFEDSPELEQVFVVLKVSEPGVDRVQRIVKAWSREQARISGRQFAPAALDQALMLTHRFLSRTRQPRKVLDLLNQAGGLGGRDQTVTEEGVIERFCQNLNIPRELVDPATPLDLGRVEQEFRARVLGQGEAVRAVIRMIGMIKAGLSDIRRPFGVFLFVGPTGVGKTHVAQLLAEFLFGSRERMIRFNMADYQDESSPLLLFGDPDGYTPAQRRGLLTQRTMGYPFAVLLLDEFEKAHAKLHDRFLQLMDEGCFINGEGETVSCRSTIIIATSNTGSYVYRGQVFGFAGERDLAQQDREVDRQLEQAFRFEFLNRFDEVVHFHPLSREVIRTIAMRELEALKDRTGMRQRRIDLEVDESVLDWLAVHGYDPDYGARFLRRTIERHVTTALAETIVRHQVERGAQVSLEVRHNRIVAQARSPRPAGAQAPRQQVTLPVGTTAQARTLDPENLIREAHSLVDRAGEHLQALAEKTEKRSELLAHMNEPAFWENRSRRQEVLDEFRTLDVAIQMESRLAKPIQKLARTKDQQPVSERDWRRLARQLESAAQSLNRWKQWLAQEGAPAVWLIVANTDPLQPAEDWIRDIVNMELAWCRQLNLSARVVACEETEGELSRVVLDVEGLGASSYLAMEEGLHRRTRSQGRDLRAKVEVLAKSRRQDGPAPAIRPVRPRPGPFHLEVSCAGRIELRDRGLGVELFGDSRETLAHLLNDVRAAWQSAVPDRPQPARIYGEAGGGARDPRSGAVVPKLRDVFKGRLDRFLQAWQDSHSPASERP